jgi:hypothetical protein
MLIQNTKINAIPLEARLMSVLHFMCCTVLCEPVNLSQYSV